MQIYLRNLAYVSTIKSELALIQLFERSGYTLRHHPTSKNGFNKLPIALILKELGFSTKDATLVMIPTYHLNIFFMNSKKKKKGDIDHTLPRQE